jgi:hypothetical protein
MTEKRDERGHRVSDEEFDPAQLNAAQLLGRRRFEELITAHGKVQAMLVLSLVGPLAIAGQHRFGDAELDQAIADADDVCLAAGEYRDVVKTLCEDWRAQRQENRDV